MKRAIPRVRRLGGLWPSLRSYFAGVPGALKDHLNSEELLRIAITALSAGSGIFGLLEAVLSRVGVVFPAPADAALAAALMTVILETRRRLGHGEPPPAARSRRQTCH